MELTPKKPTEDRSSTVINLTKHRLTKDQVSVLAKGKNFAITPVNIPTEDIISNIEVTIRCLPQTEAEEIRCEASRVLKTARNLTRT